MQKKSVNFGFRGWMLLIYQAIAFFTFTVFTNFPMNILADLYGGAQKISTIYTIANILQAAGPMMIASILFSKGYQMVFAVSAGIGVVCLILILLFSPAHVKTTDDKYRAAAGKPLDDVLAGRK